MRLLHDLFCTGSHIYFLLSTKTIHFVLMNIILLYIYRIRTHQVLYYFNKILNVLFIIQTSSTLLHVNLILHPLHFVIQTILTYEIGLTPSGKKVGFNLLDDEYFTITYITGTILNSPSVHQLPTQAKLNVWIIAINGGALDELNRCQIPREKYKVKISLYIRKIYQRTDLEEIHPIFDQVIPVVSHLDVSLPRKP